MCSYLNTRSLKRDVPVCPDTAPRSFVRFQCCRVPLCNSRRAFRLPVPHSGAAAVGVPAGCCSTGSHSSCRCPLHPRCRPGRCAPSMRPSVHKVCTRLAQMPHFSEICLIDTYSTVTLNIVHLQMVAVYNKPFLFYSNKRTKSMQRSYKSRNGFCISNTPFRPLTISKLKRNRIRRPDYSLPAQKFSVIHQTRLSSQSYNPIIPIESRKTPPYAVLSVLPPLSIQKDNTR